MRRAAGLLIALLLGCGVEPGSAPLGVVGRPEEPQLAAALPAHPRELRLGGEARRALCLPANASFEVPVDPRTRRVLFGVGVEGDGGGPPLRFAVRTPDGEAAEPLFDTRLGPEAGWRDGRIDLPDGSVPERLEFVSQTGRPSGARACWGGLTLLGLREVPAPNVVLVSLDTLGASYLGAFGGEAGVSPGLDAFLAEAFSFRRAHAQYPATLTSHASLFTGRYPIHHGHYTTARGLESLVRSFAARGYHTAAFTEDGYVGSSFGFTRGFDRFDDGAPRPRIDDALTGDARRTFDRAADWLEEHGAAVRFFLFVHTYEVHAPYLPYDDAARQLANRLTPGDERIFPAVRSLFGIDLHNRGEKLLDPPTIRRLRALYLAEILQLDHIVSRFLARLAELGLDDETLVVVTADHGELFGEYGEVGHGHSLHDRVLHVPLAFRWPGHIRPGSSDALVELVDVMPTVLELAAIAPPPDVDGRSLAPLLRGDEPAPGSAAFAELRPRAGCAPQSPSCGVHHFAVRTGRYEYVRVLGSDGAVSERLYDLETDPPETRDLSVQLPDELARHRALLAAKLAGASEPGGADLPAPGVDEVTRQRLRALGYLD